MADENMLTSQEEPCIGVILCDCGGVISNRLDLERMKKETSTLPGVLHVHHEGFPCSKDGQERLRGAVREKGMDRILIAGCSPRLMEKLFRQSVLDLGIEPGNVMVSNIRDQIAALNSTDPLAAYQKAMSIIEMGVARLSTMQTPQPRFGKVHKSALIIGGGLRGLSVALALGDKNIPVTLIDPSDGENESLRDPEGRASEAVWSRIQHAQRHQGVKILKNARLTAVHGHPGDYEVNITQGGQTSTITTGAIVVANVSKPKPLGSSHWFDRAKVKTQNEFENELETAGKTPEGLGQKDVVFILCAEESQQNHCSRVCCNIGLRQAIRVKELNPEANVTVLFRELYLSGIGGGRESELIRARKLGITFFRYRKQSPPVISDKSIDVLDILTTVPVRIPYDQVVLSMPLIPEENTSTLSTLLGLPLDEYGFLAEPRVRLRPGSYSDAGIYVLGSAQQPADTAEALFQSYLTGARVVGFLGQETIRVESPVASIDPDLCTGCGNCTQVCPANAVRLERRDGILSLSTIDELLCIGCGNCVVVCPAKAIKLPGWDNIEIPAQISAALNESRFKSGQSKILVLACEWSAYAAVEAAGHRKFPLPENTRILRMNCSARFDPFHILWAFINGADGVLLGACNPGECHYGMGNLYARERVQVLHEELAQHKIDPRRLKLEFFTVEDDEKISGIVTDFKSQLENEMTDHGKMPAGVHVPVKVG